MTVLGKDSIYIENLALSNSFHCVRISFSVKFWTHLSIILAHRLETIKQSRQREKNPTHILDRLSISGYFMG